MFPVCRRLQAEHEMEEDTKTDIEEQNNELRTQISKLSNKISVYICFTVALGIR